MLIKPLPLHRQVEDFVRSRIQSGVFAPGSRLPSTPALAKMTGTSLFTVQTALARLAGEGLLNRRAKHATYVTGDKPVLACAGLYFSKPFSLADSTFYQALSQELGRRLTGAGVKTRIWSDERDEEEQSEPPITLKRAMEKREIQALIAPLICGNDLAWLRKTPVPAAVMTTDLSMNNAVGGNPHAFLRLGLEELRDQGCRTVGMINNMLPHLDEPDTSDSDFYRSLVDIAAELKLELRNEWIRFPRQPTPHFAHFGHEQFHSLWKLPQRPEGLLVYPDGVVSGVITAILERRLKVPRDLKVVFHANDLLPYVCPFNATFLQTEVGRFADAFIQMVRTQLEGGKVNPVQISVSVIRNGNPFSHL